MAENSVQIRYENHSSDAVSDVLVYRKNTRAGLDVLPLTASQVISKVGYNGYHCFTYPIDNADRGHADDDGTGEKIYVGLVSNAVVGETLSSAVTSKDFTMFDLTGLSGFTFGLYGDLKNGYYFREIARQT